MQIYVLLLILIILLAILLISREDKVIAGGSVENDEVEHLMYDEAQNLEITNFGEPLNIEGGSEYKKWTQHKSWSSLLKDETALRYYIADRDSVWSNTNLDWSKVNEEMLPKLHDDFEYIGLINLDDDGITLRVSQLFKSNVKKGKSNLKYSFAYVPAELVKKVTDIPALFIFHTHPYGGWGMPSDYDLVTSIYHGTGGRYAADIVISEYGVILYTVNNDTRKSIVNEKNIYKANFIRYQYTLDVIMGYSSMRSWKFHRIQEIEDFFYKYRMLFRVYPSSKYVASTDKWQYDLSADIVNYDLIKERIKYVQDYYTKHKDKIDKALKF